jgi:hypothetical protein
MPASGDHTKWEQLPEAARKNNLRNGRASEAVFVRSEANEIDREDVKKLAMPTLFVSEGTTWAFLKDATKEMMTLIPEKNRE